jgi:hypothetical protein
VNKDLYGKEYEIPEHITKHLQSHSNEETIGNLLSKGNVSYSLLKKIKHRIENGEKDSLGGDTMLNWVNQTLNSDRNSLENSKTARKESGLPNSFNQSTKDNDPKGLSNMNRPSKSHHTHNDDIKITESLKRINEIISKII